MLGFIHTSDFARKVGVKVFSNVPAIFTFNFAGYEKRFGLSSKQVYDIVKNLNL